MPSIEYFSFSDHHTCSVNEVYLEGWQPERISAILNPEDAQEEGVHAEDHTSPDEDGDLLSSRVLDARSLDSEADGCECEDAVWKSVKRRVRRVLSGFMTYKSPQ